MSELELRLKILAFILLLIAVAWVVFLYVSYILKPKQAKAFKMNQQREAENIKMGLGTNFSSKGKTKLTKAQQILLVAFVAIVGISCIALLHKSKKILLK